MSGLHRASALLGQLIDKFARERGEEIETAHANEQVAGCPFILNLDQTDLHGLRVAYGRRPWQYADTDICFDHPAERFKISNFDSHVQLRMQIAGDADQECVDCTGLGQPDEVIVRNVAKWRRFTFGQWMRGRDSEYQAI